MNKSIFNGSEYSDFPYEDQNTERSNKDNMLSHNNVTNKKVNVCENESRVPSPSLIPSVNEIKEMLLQKFERYQNDIECFSKRRLVSDCAIFLCKIHYEFKRIHLSDQINAKVYFYPCPGGANHRNLSCTLFTVTGRDEGTEFHCVHCRKE